MSAARHSPVEFPASNVEEGILGPVGRTKVVYLSFVGTPPSIGMTVDTQVGKGGPVEVVSVDIQARPGVVIEVIVVDTQAR